MDEMAEVLYDMLLLYLIQNTIKLYSHQFMFTRRRSFIRLHITHNNTTTPNFLP
jgi:hypothetical protein